MHNINVAFEEESVNVNFGEVNITSIVGGDNINVAFSEDTMSIAFEEDSVNVTLDGYQDLSSYATITYVDNSSTGVITSSNYVLPNASDRIQTYHVTNSSTAMIEVSADNILGGTVYIENQYDTVTLYSDGVIWRIV